MQWNHFFLHHMSTKKSKYFYDEIVKRKRNFFALVNELCLWFQRDEMAICCVFTLALKTSSRFALLSTTQHSLCTFSHSTVKNFAKEKKTLQLKTKNHSLTNCNVSRDLLWVFLLCGAAFSCHVIKQDFLRDFITFQVF